MNVLVTGAAGFVGQHLVKELLARGDRVTGGFVEGLLPPAEPGGVLTVEERGAVHWVPLDVTDDDELERALVGAGLDCVFHLAGQSSVGSSFGDVLGTWEVNATGTLRLLVGLGRVSKRKPRVLVVSSGEVYGQVPEEEQPIVETRIAAPLSPYAAAKLGSEIVALQFARSGMSDAVVARSFNHTGPGQSSRFAVANWAEQLARIAVGRGEPTLKVGNLAARRDWLDVRDVVRAYLTLVRSGRTGEVYNVCSGTAYSLDELARMLIDVSGMEIELSVESSRLRAADIPLLVGDPGRLRALGWTDSTSLRKTLADLLMAVQAAT